MVLNEKDIDKLTEEGIRLCEMMEPTPELDARIDELARELNVRDQIISEDDKIT